MTACLYLLKGNAFKTFLQHVNSKFDRHVIDLTDMLFHTSFSLYSLQEEQPCISIGCCVDLLPQVKMILNAKYEE